MSKLSNCVLFDFYGLFALLFFSGLRSQLKFHRKIHKWFEHPFEETSDSTQTKRRRNRIQIQSSWFD